MSMGERRYENWVRVAEVGVRSVGLSHGMSGHSRHTGIHMDCVFLFFVNGCYLSFC